jgi:hypothetical protein
MTSLNVSKKACQDSSAASIDKWDSFQNMWIEMPASFSPANLSLFFRAFKLTDTSPFYVLNGSI